jgi:predicted transcriptional regulator
MSADNPNLPENGGKKEPTRSELEILQVLWKHGPSPVRRVMEEINKIRELKYTATLKLMQLMVDKGILRRDESRMQHIYYPVGDEMETKGHLLDKFLDSVYGGSATHLLMHLAGNKKTSGEDLKKMRMLLEQMERDAQKQKK